LDEVCRYILDHLVLDFEGEFTMDTLNEMLVRDGSQLARDLRARIIAEQGPNQFLLVLLDCLRESLGDGIDKARVEEQIRFYLEA
jgi:hypothetical protein